MTNLVIGAGPIGTSVAIHLSNQGRAVRVASRSGSGHDLPGVERIILDAGDATALSAALTDVSTLFLCTHASAYRADVWEDELPTLEATVLDVAARHDVTVVFPESLYAFDPRRTITETSAHAPIHALGEIRARMLAQRAASPARTISVAASDYVGPDTGPNAHGGDRMSGPASTGRTVRPLGSVDVDHAWTYLPDLAAAMVRAAELPPEPDRFLLAPSFHATQRELATAYAHAAGRETPTVRPVPGWLLRTVAAVHPGSRGVAGTLPAFEHELRIDGSATERLLGLTPTSLEAVAAATVTPASERPGHDVTGGPPADLRPA